MITCGEDDFEREPLFFASELLEPNGVLALNHHLARGHGIRDFDLPFGVFDLYEALDFRPGRQRDLDRRHSCYWIRKIESQRRIR